MKKTALLVISLLLYASGSQSAQWIKIGLKDKTITSLACDPQNGSIYAVAEGLLYLSEKDGLDWTLLKIDETLATVMKVQLDAEGYIYVGTNRGIFRSHNQDRSFRAINTGLPKYSANYPAVSAICCLDSSLAIGTSAGVFVSDKDSILWTAFNRNLPSETPNQLLCHRERLFLAANSGIYTSPLDSAQWEQCFFDCAKDLAARDSVIYAATQISGSDIDKLGALYQSSNSGSSWERLSPGEGAISGQAVFCDENRIWLGTFYGGGGLYSPNRGINWETLDFDPWFTARAFAQRASALLAGTEFYKHVDNSGGLYIQYNIFSNSSQERPFPEFITCPGSSYWSITVELSIPVDSKVYYSLDGSTPDSTSMLYSEPIVLDSTTFVKAIALFEDKTYSIVNSGLFKIVSQSGLQSVSERDCSALPYPNPASDFLHLTVQHDQTQISVVNLAGQIVYSEQDVQTGSYRLPVHTLKPGLYMLKLSSAAKTENWKFIVQP